VHALHTVHAAPDLRVAAGRLRDGGSLSDQQLYTFGRRLVLRNLLTPKRTSHQFFQRMFIVKDVVDLTFRARLESSWPII